MPFAQASTAAGFFLLYHPYSRSDLMKVIIKCGNLKINVVLVSVYG